MLKMGRDSFPHGTLSDQVTSLADTKENMNPPLIILEGQGIPTPSIQTQSTSSQQFTSTQGLPSSVLNNFSKISSTTTVEDGDKQINIMDYLKCEILDDTILRPLERDVIKGKIECDPIKVEPEYDRQIICSPQSRHTSNKRSVISKNELSSDAILGKKRKKKKKSIELSERMSACRVCGTILSIDQLKQHELMHSVGKQQQQQQEQEQEQQGGEKQLELEHSGEKPFPCEFCQQRFSSVSSRSCHIRSIHEKSQTFLCPVCEKAFNQKSNMVKHYKTIHLDSLTESCALCDRKFNQKSALNRHIKIVHKKELPYPCDQCEKKFSLTESLKKHKKSVHERTRGYPCNYCDYAASRADMLRIHVRKIHTKDWRYHCKICKEKGLSWGCILPKEIKRHMKTRHPESYSPTRHHSEYSTVVVAPQHNENVQQTAKMQSPPADPYQKRQEKETPEVSTVKESQKSVEERAQQILSQIREPLEYTSKLQAEIIAKACRAPKSVLKATQKIVPVERNLSSLGDLEKTAEEIETSLDEDQQIDRQINLIYQEEPPMSHIVAVDCEGRTRPVSELSSLFNSSLKTGHWLDSELHEGVDRGADLQSLMLGVRPQNFVISRNDPLAMIDTIKGAGQLTLSRQEGHSTVLVTSSKT